MSISTARRLLFAKYEGCKFYAAYSLRLHYNKSLSSLVCQPRKLCHGAIICNQIANVSKLLCRRMVNTSKKSAKELENQTWIPVYRFQNIVIGSIIARLKLLQTIIAAAVVPYYFWKYGLGEVQLERCLLISGLAIFAIGMLVAATRYFNRLIGVISMNQTNEVIRVGYLSFWGSRRNQIIPVKDVVPISDSDSNPNDVIVKFCRYSTPKFLYLSRIKSEIVDKERAELLFGDLTIFKNKAC